MVSLKEFFNGQDRFARFCGITLMEVSGGFSKARMEIGDQHLNAAGTVHGGALFTLADFAFAAAVNSHGRVALALNANISYFKALSAGGVLVATAKEVSLSAKIGNYTVRIEDEKGELIAFFQGTAYRKKEAIGRE